MGMASQRWLTASTSQLSVSTEGWIPLGEGPQVLHDRPDVGLQGGQHVVDAGRDEPLTGGPDSGH